MANQQPPSPAPLSDHPFLRSAPAGTKRSHASTSYLLDENDVGWYAVRMSDAALRASIEEQYFQAPKLADLTLLVRKDASSSPLEVPAFSSVLAVSSKLFERMLFGPMAADRNLFDKPRSERVLEVQWEQPELLGAMVDYLHGHTIHLTPDIAPSMYQLADFYDVEPLRDMCRRWWFDMLGPDNAVRLLIIARQLGCDPLLERCNDVMRLRFTEVLYQDNGMGSNLWELDFDTVKELLRSDALVCTNERDVLSFAAAWICKSASVTPEQTSALLDRVRWDRILTCDDGDPPVEAAAAAAAEQATSSRTRSRVGDCDDLAEEHKERVCTLERMCERLRKEVARFCDIDPEDTRPPPLKRFRGLVTTERLPVPFTVRDDLPEGLKVCLRLESMVRQRILDAHGGVTLAAPAKLSSQPRQFSWGLLKGLNPMPPAPQEFQGVESIQKKLKGDGKPITVGRSRSASLRVGFRQEPFFVTGIHFNLSPKVLWVSKQSEIDPLGVALRNTDNPNSCARLVATVQDCSTNGTWVNNDRLRKFDTPLILKDGDRISLVHAPNGPFYASNPTHREAHYIYKLPSTRAVKAARAAAHVARAAREAAAAAAFGQSP